MKILKQYIPKSIQETMELEMIQKDPIFEKTSFDNALLNGTWISDRFDLTIKDTWIYEHFSNELTKKSKIALYVNEVIPINQNLDISQINSIGNHCVVVSGLTKWPKNDQNGIECLELEIYGGSDEMRYIPVEFPFFEKIYIEVKKIVAEQYDKGSDIYNSHINKFGKRLAKKKWGRIKNNWFEQKPGINKEQKNVDEAKQQFKYDMIFVRGIYPCYQLKFTS